MTNEMTAKEAVKQIKGNCYFASISEKTKEALDMAIKALEQQQDVHDTCKNCIEFSEFKQQPIIDTRQRERQLEMEYQNGYDKGWEAGRKALEQQPCIEDYPTCTECEHYDSEKHYCPRFCQVIKDTLAEAQPSEDCISRQAVLDKAFDFMDDDCETYRAVYVSDIRKLPSVIPQRPKGKWIVFRCGDTDTFKCSECGMRVINPYKYCPNCGAKMSGGGEDGEDSACD